MHPFMSSSVGNIYKNSLLAIMYGGEKKASPFNSPNTGIRLVRLDQKAVILQSIKFNHKMSCFSQG